jgi:hypothetical protein
LELGGVKNEEQRWLGLKNPKNNLGGDLYGSAKDWLLFDDYIELPTAEAVSLKNQRFSCGTR